MCYEFMIFEVLYGYKTRMCLRLQLIHRQKLIVPHYYVFQFCHINVTVFIKVNTGEKIFDLNSIYLLAVVKYNLISSNE